MKNEIIPTKEQEDIINYNASLVAIAKPGSGKTFVIAKKIRAKLSQLKEFQGVIGISYTNKASEEIRRRVGNQSSNLHQSFFGTIDRFCDSEIIIPFLPQIWGKAKTELTVHRIKDLSNEERELFSGIQENQVSLEILQRNLAVIRSHYESGRLLLETNGALALFTLLNSKACRAYLKARYTTIYIDEYQDAGLEQHELFLHLQKLGLTAIAVGDANQSIFKFSGKDPKYLLDLAGMKEFKTFPISFNHRCHLSITDYSLRLFDENYTPNFEGPSQVYYGSIRGNQRAISTWIDSNIGTFKNRFDVSKNSEIAVLVRSTKSGELVDSSLSLKHRFVRIHPLEEHFSLWARLFARLLGLHFNETVTAQEIVDEFGSRLLTQHEVRVVRKRVKCLRGEKLPDFKEFVDIATLLLPEARSETAIELLKESLQDPNLPTNFSEPNQEEIQILTLHKSKGLEFDIVFHLDLYEYVLPHKEPGPNRRWEFSDWKQDLNLHYVGVTRARKCCILLTSDFRINGKGKEIQGRPSEFLDLNNLGLFRRNAQEVLEGT